MNADLWFLAALLVLSVADFLFYAAVRFVGEPAMNCVSSLRARLARARQSPRTPHEA